MNSKRMLLRLLRLGLLNLLFVHQTRPALSIIEKSVKELIVERTVGYFDLFTVKMKTDRTCDLATCTSLGAHLLSLPGSSCSCRCGNYQPFTFLSSIQRCANTTQVQDFGGELSIHHININQIALSLCCILENAECKTGQYRICSVDCGLRTADHVLRTRYKTWTRKKMQTPD